MTFLLCDFGKINLRNLQKLQKLDLSKGEDYVKASGLKIPKPNQIDLRIHDSITHQHIPTKYYKKYLSLNYKPTSSKNLLLNNSSKNSIGDNIIIEEIANGIEKQNLTNNLNKENIMGLGIRRKKLSKVEKLATGLQSSHTIKDIYKTQRKPTQEDVYSLIQEARQYREPKSQSAPKTKGSKPREATIEEKKQKLAQKYGIS